MVCCMSIFSGRPNFNPIWPGLFLGAWARGEGEGRKVSAAHKSKTIHGIDIKFGRVVENHKLINLVEFNW